MAIPSPITMAFQTPRRATGRAKYALFAVVILCFLFYLRNSTSTTFSSALRPIKPQRPSSISPLSPSKPGGNVADKTNSKPAKHSHPIDTLIGTAEKTFQGLLKKETHNLKSAAAEYRRRRGRHPPPGFDVWYKFAKDNGAVMVEDFFDQIQY